MSYGKHRADLVGSEGTHPSPADAESGRIGKAFHVADVALLLVNGGAALVGKCAFLVVGTYVFGLRGKHHPDFNAHTNLHGILDTETQLQGNLAIGRVDLVTLEAINVAVALVFEVAVCVRVQDARVGEIVVRRHAQTDGNGVLGAFAQGEIVGKGEAHALVETARVPVVAWGKLEIAEQVEAEGDLVVGFVGDKLGEGSRRND